MTLLGPNGEPVRYDPASSTWNEVHEFDSGPHWIEVVGWLGVLGLFLVLFVAAGGIQL